MTTIIVLLLMIMKIYSDNRDDIDIMDNLDVDILYDLDLIDNYDGVHNGVTNLKIKTQDLRSVDKILAEVKDMDYS